DTTLFVGFDRLSFLAGEHGTGRSSRLERPSPSHRTVALPHDSAVVRNYTYAPERQFAVFSEDGGLRTDMGRGWETGAGRDVYTMLAELGPASGPHQFWSAPQRYRLEAQLWDARSGAPIRGFVDSADWYVPYDSAALHQFLREGNDVENPPLPFLRGIRETADS